MLLMLEGPNTNADVWAYGLDTSQALISVYAMRMAAVFTSAPSGFARRHFRDGSPTPGYLIALALLLASADQKWIQLLFPSWVLLVSAVLLLTSPVERRPGTD